LGHANYFTDEWIMAKITDYTHTAPPFTSLSDLSSGHFSVNCVPGNPGSKSYFCCPLKRPDNGHIAAFRKDIVKGYQPQRR